MLLFSALLGEERKLVYRVWRERGYCVVVLGVFHLLDQ